MKALITGLCILTAGAASAADIEMTQLSEESGYKITIDGAIENFDGTALNRLIADNPEDTHYDIYLNSPGGYAYGMEDVYDIVSDLNATTIIEEGAMCYSACAVIWMASADRMLIGDASADFHIGSIPSIEYWETIKEGDGWYGVEEAVQQGFSQSMSYYFTMHDVKNMLGFIKGIIEEGFDRNNFFTIDRDNLQVVGGRAFG